MIERAPLPKIGDKLGDFSLVEVVNDDGLIALFEAVQGSTRQVVMLEVLAHDIITNAPTSAARRLRELEVVQWLGQPQYAPKVYAQGETSDGLPWTAFERLRGETLQELLTLGDVEDMRAYSVMLQLLAALADLHGRGLVHGHLQPSSILTTKGSGELDEVKLIDLGYVTSTEHKEFPPGSPFAGLIPDSRPAAQYGAPEVLAGSDHTVRADVFTAGLLLYETLTGRPAFEASDGAVSENGSFDVGALAARRKRLPLELPDPWKQTPVAAIVSKATAYQPGERYPNGMAFYTALSALDPAIFTEAEQAQLAAKSDAKQTARYDVMPPKAAGKPEKIGDNGETIESIGDASGAGREMIARPEPVKLGIPAKPARLPSSVEAAAIEEDDDDLEWPEVAEEEERSIVERLAGRSLKEGGLPSGVQSSLKGVPEFALPTEGSAGKWKVYAMVAVFGAVVGAGLLYLMLAGTGDDSVNSGAVAEKQAASEQAVSEKDTAPAPVPQEPSEPQEPATSELATDNALEEEGPLPDETYEELEEPVDDGSEAVVAAAQQRTENAVEEAATTLPDKPPAPVQVWTLTSEPAGATVHAGEPVDRVLCEATPCDVALPRPDDSIPIRFVLDGHAEVLAIMGPDASTVAVALEVEISDSERRRALRRAKRRELRRSRGGSQRSASNPFGARTFD